MPSNWNASTVTAKFVWLANSASTNSVIWGLQGRAFADSDAVDQAWGTAQTAAEANNAANDINISAATSAITLAGTPAASQMVQFRAYRDANAGGDDLAADARLISIIVDYGVA